MVYILLKFDVCVVVAVVVIAHGNLWNDLGPYSSMVIICSESITKGSDES